VGLYAFGVQKGSQDVPLSGPLSEQMTYSPYSWGSKLVISHEALFR